MLCGKWIFEWIWLCYIKWVKFIYGIELECWGRLSYLEEKISKKCLISSGIYD